VPLPITAIATQKRLMSPEIGRLALHNDTDPGIKPLMIAEYALSETCQRGSRAILASPDLLADVNEFTGAVAHFRVSSISSSTISPTTERFRLVAYPREHINSDPAEYRWDAGPLGVNSITQNRLHLLWIHALGELVECACLISIPCIPGADRPVRR
jgi:hypothetical protein